MQTNSQLQVNVSAIAHNVHALNQLIGDEVQICGVIKADAYGLGAAAVTQTLVASGMNRLAVFGAEEALEVLPEASGIPVILLGPLGWFGPVHPIHSAIVSGLVEPVIHDQRMFSEILELARSASQPVGIHVEVDVGMCRGGMQPDEAVRMVQMALRAPCLELRGVMCHFSSAGTSAETTCHEHAVFAKALQSMGPLPATCCVHAAATAAAVHDCDSRHDMVRIGLGWSGHVPGSRGRGHASSLIPAIRWRTELTHTHEIEAGSSVVYGRKCITPKATKIGIVPVGYADGVPPHAGLTADHQGARVAVYSPRSGMEQPIGTAPIVGAVSMDQMAIDLGSLPCGIDPSIGWTIDLVTPAVDGPTSLIGFAAACDVTPHQFLAGIGPRVRRIVVSPPIVQSSSPQAAAV